MTPPVVDETAGDLPVRDVGLSRRGLIPIVQDTKQDLKPWKRNHVLKTKDTQRLFRFPREHLEDLCLRLQEENSVLRQHTRTQEQRLRRMSTRLMRLHQARPGSSGMKERGMEDTIQELEAHVAMLESQKRVLQNKLSLAKQHILDLGGRTQYKFSKGKTRDMDDGVKRAPQTAPPRYGPMLEDTRMEMERFRPSVAEQVRIAELELTAQALREREREIEETVTDLRKQQSERHRLTIRDDIDLIRLQKQMSDKSTALKVTQEKLNNMQEAYEDQLQESQRSLRENQEALLDKVEELTEQLKQERQRTLALEGELTTSTLSSQTVDKLQERISDLEGERDLIKENYDTLLDRTLVAEGNHVEQVVKGREDDQSRGEGEETFSRIIIQRLEENLQAEREERGRLRMEKEDLRREKESLAEQRGREREFSVTMKQQHLEQEVLHYKEQISSLQGRLDSVTQEFDMSVEELSEVLLQIKAFRFHQESRARLGFLSADGKMEDSLYETTHIQASHAETVLELQKTRNLLHLEHSISKDLQEELNTANQKTEKDKEESRRRMAEKDKLLSQCLLQINSLQAQKREYDYGPKSTIPLQYTWPTGNLEGVQPVEDIPYSQLRFGESLLEIHLKAATFTPSGLRAMGRIHSGGEDTVTFCTYSLLDFETHSTPLVSGSQPSYSFTSHYALTGCDLCRLEGQGSRVRVELHQALGGVRFLTHGSGEMSLTSTMEKRGERINRCTNIIGSEGEIVGVLEFWVRLFNSAAPIETVRERGIERRTALQSPQHISPDWQDAAYEELYEYGGGIPNELEVMLEYCVGLKARWPLLPPDAYLTYRLYDLQPHVSQRIRCTVDPGFSDTASYPLAVTADVLHYLRSSSLWVYVFDNSADRIPPTYIAKTPIPLRVLASGQDIRGDYVLRDPSGIPRGMFRVMIRWKHPLHPSLDSALGRRGREDRGLESIDSKERRRREAEIPLTPKTRPGVKPRLFKHKRSENVRPERPVSVTPTTDCQSTYQKRSTKTSRHIHQGTPHLKPEAGLAYVAKRRSSDGTSSKVLRQSVSSDARTEGHLSMEEEEKEQRESSESDAPESSETSSSQSDILIVPPMQNMKKGINLRVEILSLKFEPTSHVALDKSVQRIYVEYRLLGIPMETTETPMSLRKPVKGEEVHYNFTRVIYVDGSQAAPLRQYLYTMMEGTDPNQGRLKFTVVSEPMDNDHECVDVGYAFLNLQELLLTGNDVINHQLDIVSVDEETEVIGNLRVSLEAAKTLTGIYHEFCKTKETEDTTDGEELDEEQKREEEKKNQEIQVIDYDYDSDF
ncbi:protein fantom [Notolabrus celidotus]|uniref:protein fantom n=1 Tax=Notolabrus celidotus TaxID=1203425 RepID=UPI00148FAC8A|nr:protein fantom [Notolabrus celidotus]